MPRAVATVFQTLLLDIGKKRPREDYGTTVRPIEFFLNAHTHLNGDAFLFVAIFRALAVVVAVRSEGTAGRLFPRCRESNAPCRRNSFSNSASGYWEETTARELRRPCVPSNFSNT